MQNKESSNLDSQFKELKELVETMESHQGSVEELFSMRKRVDELAKLTLARLNELEDKERLPTV